MTLKVFFLLLALLAGSGASAQDFNFNAYQPKTLGEFRAFLNEMPIFNDETGQLTDYFLVANPEFAKFLIKGRYQGDFRPLSENNRILFEMWAGQLQLGPDFVSLYQNEVLVLIEGEPFWIPTQRPLEDFLKEELAKEDDVLLYLVFIGALKGDPVLLMTEFQTSN